MRNIIRPYYSELQDCLSQAPELSDPSNRTRDNSLWIRLNDLVGTLNEITGKDYSRFEVTPRSDEAGRPYLLVITYRNKLGRLIASLHGDYFSDEAAPFSDTPNQVIHQTQAQIQSIGISFILDIVEKIDQELPRHEDGSKDKEFLQRVKDSLRGITDTTQCISNIFNISKDFNLSAGDVVTLLAFSSS
jgi:hypothetical protein